MKNSVMQFGKVTPDFQAKNIKRGWVFVDFFLLIICILFLNALCL